MQVNSSCIINSWAGAHYALLSRVIYLLPCMVLHRSQQHPRNLCDTLTSALMAVELTILQTHSGSRWRYETARSRIGRHLPDTEWNLDSRSKCCDSGYRLCFVQVYYILVLTALYFGCLSQINDPAVTGAAMLPIRCWRGVASRDPSHYQLLAINAILQERYNNLEVQAKATN